MQIDTPIVLASRSPRRYSLLRQIGLSFTVEVSGISEEISKALTPDVAVEELALRKAKHISTRHPECLTIGADTTVVLNGESIGKPTSASDAISMLRKLSSRTHVVYTGIALVHPRRGKCVTAHEKTEVTFAELSTSEIEAYVKTGSPMDKAGAYGIQDDLGAIFVSRINGDYYNVVGFPLHRFYALLKEHFGACP